VTALIRAYCVQRLLGFEKIDRKNSENWVETQSETGLTYYSIPEYSKQRRTAYQEQCLGK
jgi:hypothetical protein